MKKFLTIMTLVLALCLACGMAMAAPNYDDYKVIEEGNGYKLAVYDDVAGEWVEYDLILGNVKYDEYKDADEDDLYVVEEADCDDDAVLKLLPNNADDDKLEWNEDKLEVKGIPEKFVENLYKDVDFAELTKKNPELAKQYKKLGHKILYLNNTADCVNGGTAIPYCTECDYVGDVIETKPLGHVSSLSDADIEVLIEDGEFGKYELIAAPDCKNEGSYEGPCARCEEDAVFSIAKDKDAHVYGTWQDRIPAECESVGLQYRICKVCLDAQETRVSPAKGHGKWIYEDIEVEGDCNSTGLAAKVVCGNDCGLYFVFTEGGARVDQNGDSIKKYYPDAIPSALGYKTYEGKQYFVVPVDSDAHPTEGWIKVAYGTKVLTKDGVELTAKKATCKDKGLDVFQCPECGLVADSVVTAATGHDMAKIIVKKVGDDFVVVKAASCEEDAKGKQYAYQEWEYCKNENSIKVGDTLSYNKQKYTVTNDKVAAPAHTFGAWAEHNAPSNKTPGKWVRKCSVCYKVEEYFGYTAPVEGTTLALNEDGVWAYYKDGKFDATKTGIVEFNGAEFAVVKGLVDTSLEGLQQFPAEKGEWYFFSAGQVAAYTGLVQYDGEWFYVENGKLDTELAGVVEYDGNLFYVGAGQVQDVDGLKQDPVYTGDWYYLADGMVQSQYTGVVFYDGAAFYVVNGKLASDMFATIEYDGVKFIVAGGQLYAL